MKGLVWNMYFKDKKETVIVRVSEEQADFIEYLANVWGCSKSEVMRKILDTFRLQKEIQKNAY